MVGFDLETTSPLPEEARIVTASLVEVGGGEGTETFRWLADPGVEIPESAAEVHGITTERARAEGRRSADVVAEVVTRLAMNLGEGRALVVFNARYDLTVLDRECRRHGVRSLTDRAELRVVDPLVIDKWLHRYRKGPRNLGAMCDWYGAVLDSAHDSDSDALAAARLAWVLGAKATVVRRVQSPRDVAELAELQAEWAYVRGELSALHEAQVRWALEERERFAEYKLSVGEVQAAARIRLEQGWPILDVMPHEEWEAVA